MAVSSKIAGDLDSANAGASLNRTGFVAAPDNSANNGAFPSSSFDVFGITDRTVNFDFADDSAGSFAPDTFGILKTGDTAPFFGAQDVDNSDNPGGGGTASWSFDISGSTLTDIMIDFAAMGDFEVGDNAYTITGAIDGGSATTLFSLVTDDTISHTYTLESGTTNTIVDPLVLGGTVVDNTFATFTSSALSGLSGTSLDITLTAATNNGGGEAFALRDIAIMGTPIGLPNALTETFDDASGFTASAAFFSDGGGDYFGISDGAGAGDFGTDPTPAAEKSYSGATGTYLTGMDLDGEGATLPITVEWTNLDITALTNIEFSGDFAEAFDSPGDIDASDQLFVEARIDGGAYTPIMAFVGADFTSSSGTSNGVFRHDTNLDGIGDGAILTDAFASFTAPITGTGGSMDLRLTASVNSGDEDFAVDNFIVREFVPPVPGITVTGAPAIAEGGATDTFSIALDTTPAAQVDITLTADAQTELSLDGSTFASTIVASLTDTAAATITVRAIDDAADEGTHTGNISFAVASTDPDYSAITLPDIAATITDNDLAVTKIHNIQGSPGAWGSEFGYDDVSPLDGTIVKIQGIVVGDFQDGASGTHGDLNGFFVQEEDADADADPLTSEGIYVFDGTSPAIDVQIGDLVEITGTVDEFFGETQLTNITSLNVLSMGNTLPTAATITFPVASVVTNPAGQINADLEAFEGMRVTIPNTEDLVVSDVFTLGRFGELGLTAGGREEAFTQNNAPDAAGFAAFENDVVRKTIVLDDGASTQNPATLPYPDGDFDGNEGLRAGDSVQDVTGIVRYSSGSGSFGDSTYRINPTQAPTFINDNPRETAPELTGSLTVASMNVFNFFTTIDGSGFTSGPSGLDPRGADSASEYQRQLDKLVTTLSEMDADIVGLMEMENEFGADVNGDGNGWALDALVAALNSALGAGTYAYVDPGQAFVDTSDAISQAFIYKTASVGLAAGTTVEILDDSDLAGLGLGALGPVFDGSSTNRAALAATFEELATGEELTVAVNHFKSKGDFSGTASGGDADLGDGAASYNEMRTKGATALDAWLDTDPTGSGDADFLIIGDLNAYAMEDPVQYLLTQGYTDLAATYTMAGDLNYSFGFPIDLTSSSQAQVFGTLDYGLANGALAAQVTDAQKWHINADEPDFLSYNEEFKNLDPFDSSNAFRSSDHDPLVIGLSLFTSPDVFAVYSDASFTTLLSTHISFGAAEAAAGASQGIRALNAAAAGDIGNAVVSTEGLTILADAPVTGTLNLTSAGGATSIDLQGSNSLSVTGGAAANLLNGSDGANALSGFGGQDTLLGGAGDDTLLGGGADDYLQGDGGADSLEGGSGADTIEGGSGHDTIKGGAGNDGLLFGGEGDDRIIGDGGHDSLAGGDGDDSLYGNDGNDDALGGAGNDLLIGGMGFDTLDGGADNDHLFGGSGRDLLKGGSGNDTLNGQGREDTLEGGSGDDVLFGGASADELAGGDGQDSLDGGASHDLLFGGAGQDMLQGSGGRDTLDGGTGDDTLEGGLGTDTFAFSTNWGTDVITDFNDGTEFMDMSASGLLIFAELTIMSAGSDTTISDASGNTITLLGVAASNVDGNDFLF